MCITDSDTSWPFIFSTSHLFTTVWATSDNTLLHPIMISFGDVAAVTTETVDSIQSGITTCTCGAAKPTNIASGTKPRRIVISFMVVTYFNFSLTFDVGNDIKLLSQTCHNSTTVVVVIVVAVVEQ